MNKLQFFTFPAGGALATALMLVKLNQTCNSSYHVSLQEGKRNKSASVSTKSVFSVKLFSLLTDLSMTMIAAVPRAVSTRIRSSKIHQNVVACMLRDNGSGGPSWDHA